MDVGAAGETSCLAGQRLLESTQRIREIYSVFKRCESTFTPAVSGAHIHNKYSGAFFNHFYVIAVFSAQRHANPNSESFFMFFSLIICRAVTKRMDGTAQDEEYTPPTCYHSTHPNKAMISSNFSRDFPFILL